MSSVHDTYRALSRLLDDASALLDDKGIVIAADQQMFDLLGMQITGFPLERFIRAPQFHEKLEQARRDNQMTEFDYLRMDKTRREFRVRMAPLDDVHILLIVSDKTDVLAINRVHSEFVANVSHELRSPLTALSGFIETLQDGAAQDEAARTHFLSIMQTEAARMQRLIDDLLSLSRVETEEHRMPDGEVDLLAVLHHVVSISKERAAARDMELHLEIDEAAAAQTSLIVVGSGDELQQVFLNLLENAVRYGDANTPVRLLVSAGRATPDAQIDDNLVRVQVINQGPVIAEEHIARLTERFYRIDSGRSREMGGTGLGLAIVKHIINRHRGRLRITSNPQATVFSVTLPRFQ